MDKKPLKEQNWLFKSMPIPEWERLLPHIHEFDMPLGLVISESGDKANHLYFPTTAIVSLLYGLENGASAEIAVVGNEGCVGISLFMGGKVRLVAL